VLYPGSPTHDEVLTAKELCHALAIEIGDRALIRDRVYDAEDLVSVCSGLVTLDHESGFIRFVHYTTQEYFERVILKWHPDAQEEIVKACLTYLSFDTFRHGSYGKHREFLKALAENEFFDYSASYWADHTRPVESITSQLALAFLCDDGSVSSMFNYVSLENKLKMHPFGPQVFTTKLTPLHLTARYGFLYLTERLLNGEQENMEYSVNSQDREGRTPLSFTAVRGHDGIVKALLGRDDIEPDVKTHHGWTPLCLAACRGHSAVVKLPLERDDIDANSAEDIAGLTSLLWAARRGDEAVVRSLLQREDVDPNHKDYNGHTALSWAALEGREEVVRLLLSNDNVKTDLKDIDGRAALHWASYRGHGPVAHLLLEREDVDVNAQDARHRTPLFDCSRGTA